MDAKDVVIGKCYILQNLDNNVMWCTGDVVLVTGVKHDGQNTEADMFNIVMVSKPITVSRGAACYLREMTEEDIPIIQFSEGANA